MTGIHPSQWASGLVEVLDRQQELYRQLEDLAGEQGRLVQSGDSELLLALLSRRQALIDRLTEVGRELEPYKQQWPEAWGQLERGDRDRIGKLVRHVQDALDRIMRQDERDRDALTQQRQQAQQSLQRMHRGSSMHRAYQQSSGTPATPRYADQKG